MTYYDLFTPIVIGLTFRVLLGSIETQRKTKGQRITVLSGIE